MLRQMFEKSMYGSLRARVLLALVRFKYIYKYHPDTENTSMFIAQIFVLNLMSFAGTAVYNSVRIGFDISTTPQDKCYNRLIC